MALCLPKRYESKKKEARHHDEHSFNVNFRKLLLLYYQLLSTYDIDAFGGIRYTTALKVVDKF